MVPWHPLIDEYIHPRLNLEMVKISKTYIPKEKEKYMCTKHLAFFKKKLTDWKTDLVKIKILAGNIAKELGKIIGGGGGGKPHLATAGGKYSHKLQDAMDQGKEMAHKLILKETNGS